MDFQTSQQISCSLLSSERRRKPLGKQNTHKTIYPLVPNYYNQQIFQAIIFSTEIFFLKCSTPLSPVAVVLLVYISHEIEYSFCFIRGHRYDKICVPLEYNTEYSNVIQLSQQILPPDLFFIMLLFSTQRLRRRYHSLSLDILPSMILIIIKGTEEKASVLF